MDKEVILQSNMETVLDLIRSRQTNLESVKTAFKNIHNAGAQSGLDAQVEKKVDPPIYPDQVMNGKMAELPTITAVAKTDTSQAMGKDMAPDPQPTRQKQDVAVGEYLDADMAIKSQFIAALKEQDLEVGQMMEKAMWAPGGPSAFVDAAKEIIDPGIGDLYTALSSLMGQPNNDRVNQAIDSTLRNLQAANDTKNDSYMSRTGNVQKVDWSKFQSGQQVRDFLKRDVDQDPFMKKAKSNELQIQDMEHNKQLEKDFVDGKIAVRDAGTIAKAVEAGDQDLVKTLMKGDQGKTDLAMKGQVQQAMAESPRVADTADEVKMFVAAGREISGIKVKTPDVSDISETVKEIAKAAYMPPKPLVALNSDIALTA